MTRIIQSLNELSHGYEAIYCDLWGCLHNGVSPFPAAVLALERFRDAGGLILLLTNSPRPKAAVISQLDDIGVARDLYHEVASSGDSARFALASGAYGQKVYHLGPERDLSFFDPADEPGLDGLSAIERVPLDQADSIVCTGLFDDSTETPQDYRATFLAAKNRNLKMLCANPDVMVDKGDTRIYCAGALAAAFGDMGGEVHYFGKPHAPIYDLARNRLTELTGIVIDEKRILCIGDGINTDIRGGIAENLDTLFISGGLAATETGTGTRPDPGKLARFLQNAQMSPTATIGHLR
jgi:HAD superfamily hydrolase (TIGR01459 family)